MTEQERPIELRYWQHGLIFVLACAVVVARRPDAVFHPQFYAEDGHVWFADAYNFGWWQALFRTWAGYFQTLPRLGAALALLVPLKRVPLLLNLIAICIQALPANLLLGSRSAAWGTLRFRALLAGVYLALPNCTEVSYGLTDADILLALSAILVLAARPPQTWAGRAFDVFILALCGLSGPFCIFFLPIALFLIWRERKGWRRIETAVLVFCCAIQAWVLLLLAPAARSHRALGASLEMFVRILSGDVYLGALLGGNTLALQAGKGLAVLLIAVGAVGTVLVAMCLVKSPSPMKIFVLFCGGLFLSSLITPVEWARPDLPVWTVLAGSAEHRYWFFPTLAFAWTLLWCVQSKSAWMKIVAGYLLLAMCFGILRDWRHRAFDDIHFPEAVRQFQAAPAGAIVTMQEYPRGWTMTLVKHAGAQ